MILYNILYKNFYNLIFFFTKFIIAKYRSFIKFTKNLINYDYSMRGQKKYNNDVSSNSLALINNQKVAPIKTTIRNTGNLIDYDMLFLDKQLNFLSNLLFINIKKFNVYFLINCMYFTYFNFSKMYKLLFININHLNLVYNKFFFLENKFEFV
jgi:hypothetical protein